MIYFYVLFSFTNLLLMFAFPSIVLYLLLFFFGGIFLLYLQMAPSPIKKKTTAKKGDKRLKMDNTKFRSLQHFKRYTQFYIKATIIQERFVDLVDLKDIFIPSCFEGRGWDKLLSDLPEVCEPLIREFYANARLREHEINCWI